MRLFLILLSLLLASPVAADVTHSIEARFGVAYRSGPAGAPGRLQELYEGRYTSTFTHQSDNGLRFRFDLGVAAGNFEPNYPGERDPRRFVNGFVGE